MTSPTGLLGRSRFNAEATLSAGRVPALAGKRRLDLLRSSLGPNLASKALREFGRPSPHGTVFQRRADCNAESLRGQPFRRQWLGASANLPHRLSPEVLVSLERADDAGAPGAKSGSSRSGASVMDDGRNPGKQPPM